MLEGGVLGSVAGGIYGWCIADVNKADSAKQHAKLFGLMGTFWFVTVPLYFYNSEKIELIRKLIEL